MKDQVQGMEMWRIVLWMSLALMLLIGSVVVSFWYMPVIRKNEGMQREVHALKQKVSREREMARELTFSIKALQTDTNTIARMARGEAGLAGEGESIVRFE